jgi:membrane-associated phospholipid phosphatase
MKFITYLILSLMAIPFAQGTTIKEDLLSPVTTNAAPFFWSGTFMTTFLLLTEESISDPLSEKSRTDKPLGDASRLGDYYGQLYPNALYTLGMLADGYFSERSGLSYGKARHMFKATLYSSLLTTILKYTVREPRPNSIEEKNSFPSGHTTTAFAFATVVSLQHEWYWGFAALGGAALTGFSRMNDGRHFLHDVVAGMTIGVSYGLGTYLSTKGEGAKVGIVPILDHQRTGLRFISQF